MPKKSPRTSYIVQIIFSFLSFEISEGILRNQKIIIGLDSFSKFNIFGPIWIILIFLSTSLQNYSNSLWLHVAKSEGLLRRLE